MEREGEKKRKRERERDCGPQVSVKSPQTIVRSSSRDITDPAVPSKVHGAHA